MIKNKTDNSQMFQAPESLHKDLDGGARVCLMRVCYGFYFKAKVWR